MTTNLDILGLCTVLVVGAVVVGALVRFGYWLWLMWTMARIEAMVEERRQGQ